MVGSTIGQLSMKNKLATKKILIETTIILTFRLRIENFISTLVPFNWLNQILLEQARELVLELEIFKFDISLLNRMYINCEGGWGNKNGDIFLQCMIYWKQAL